MQGVRVLLDGLAKQGLRVNGAWAPPEFVRAVCHAVQDEEGDLVQQANGILELGKVRVPPSFCFFN
jgi:hypothetical protein